MAGIQQQQQLVDETLPDSWDESGKRTAARPGVDHELKDPSQQKSGWRKFLSYVGPGFLVSLAYIDPGNLETDLQAGADHRYELLWVVLIGLIFALTIQSLAANLGVTTGKHLSELCKAEYPKYVNYCLWLLAEIAVMAADIPEVIGTAFALNILFNIPVWVGVLCTGCSTLLLLALQRYGVRKLELLIAVLVFVMAACFFGELRYVKPPATDVLEGMLIPKLSAPGSTGDAIALLGALVMPHNLFLHSALVLSRKIPYSVRGINVSQTAKLYYIVETFVEGGSGCLSLFPDREWIRAVCSIFNQSRGHLRIWDCLLSSKIYHLKMQIDVEISPLTLLPSFFRLKSHQKDDTNAYVQNVLGKSSSKIYAIAVLASGQSSTITGTYAGQYIMQGFLELKMKTWTRNLVTRSIAITPSLIVSIIGGSTGAGRLIIIASMILSFELPFALIPLLKFSSSSTKMGPHKNSIYIIVLSWILGLGIIGINVYYLSTGFVGWIINNNLPKAASVLIGIIVFPLMAIYILAVIYLTVRKDTAVTFMEPNKNDPQQQINMENGLAKSTEDPGMDPAPYREDLADIPLPRIDGVQS
ncbi:SOLUTE CARRIER PROTEIN FAMILY 11 MEMBER [Salix koriyanagi]|uniref:SOLUTE CARRIER PROTEIN FAMILY 11 MEMBER n=1 Tax=Salix koriyanagi TaxID=2511006 RepID=A0A9Q0TCX8_9ROSI|nr:SOLUTE CARRIER PROTEIN FAMILY 11 MEMBER [Salix koriyanagi]